MRKILAIEIPEMVYNNCVKEINEIIKNDAECIIISDKIYVTQYIKSLDYLEFNNEIINQENKENTKLAETFTNFHENIIPNVLDVWNKFNEKELKKLKAAKSPDIDIELFFVNNKLTFADTITCKIFYI